jgi:hypothetical protein
MNKHNLAACTKRALALFLTIALTIITAGYGLEQLANKLDPNYPKIKADMLLKDSSYDLIILGDSTTAQSVNPKQLFKESSKTAYNLATSGANFISMLTSLKHYIQNNQKPKLVAIGIYVNKNDQDIGISSNVYLGLNKKNRKETDELLERFDQPKPDWKHQLLNSIQAYRFRGSIESALKVIIQGKQRIPEFINGHLALSIRQLEPLKLPAPFQVGFKEPMLRELLLYCSEQNINTVLFEPPNNKGYSKIVRGREEALKSIYTMTTTEFSTKFTSFNEPNKYPFPPSEWINVNHLNKFGAARFSAQLLGPWLLTQF